MIGALRWIISAARTLTQELSNRPETTGAHDVSDSILLGSQQGGDRLSRSSTVKPPQPQKKKDVSSEPVMAWESTIRELAPSQSVGVPTVLTDGDVPPPPKTLRAPSGSDAAQSNQTEVQLRREASDRYCEALGEWARRLTKENLDPQEFQKVSRVLAGVASETPFPMARDVARTLLREYVKWQDPVIDWSIKFGAIDGPAEYIQSRADEAGSQSYYFDASCRIPQFVDALDKHCARDAVPQNALKAVTHSAYIWTHRAENVTNEEVRKHESVDFDRGLSDKFASLVVKWWRNGQVRVLLDGQPVAPGFDVKKAISTEPVAVRDGSIQLRSVRPDPPDDVRKQADQIAHGWWKEEKETEPKAVVALRDLAHNDFTRAVAVVATMLDRAERGYGYLEGLVCGLSGAKSDVPLQNVFRTFLPRLSTLVSEADARGHLATDNMVGEAQASLFGALAEAFPQAVDAGVVARELSPMLHTSEPNTVRRAAEVAEKLMDQRPDLVSAVAECVTSADKFVDNYAWGVLHVAAEKHGWVPNGEQLDWIGRRLWMPVGKKDDWSSVFSGTEGAASFFAALGVLNVLKKSHPEMVDAVRIPDVQFHVQPLKAAIFDRVFSDLNDDPVRRLYEKWGSISGSTVYDFCFPDAQRTQELMSKVERELQSGHHILDYLQSSQKDYISVDAQKALAVLMSIPLNEKERHQLETMVGPEVYHANGHFAFSHLMQPLRMKTQKEALARLDQTQQSASATFATASDVLTLQRASDDIDAEKDDASKKLSAPIQGAFGKLSPVDLVAERDRRFGIFEVRLQKQGLADLSERELADTQLLTVCAAMDTTFSERLRETLRPYCNSRMFDGLMEDVLKGLRAELREKDFERLRTTDLSRADRAALVDAIIEQAKATCEDVEVEPQAISAAVEGLRHTGGVEDLPEFFATPEEAYEFYGGLAPKSTDDKAIAAEWANVREVFVYMGGPAFTRDEGNRRKALELKQFVDERAAAGEPRDKVLQHVLTCYFNNRDPRTTPEYDEEARRKAAAGVVTHERSVTIGDVEVPRNVDRSAYKSPRTAAIGGSTAQSAWNFSEIFMAHGIYFTAGGTDYP